MAYSQNNEEQIILDELAKLGITKGRFLDIGAYDGKTLSNTYRLSELGWQGVCVEPSPNVFPNLIKNYNNNCNVIFVNAAVYPRAELVEWHDSNGDAVSTTNQIHKNKWLRQVKYTSFWVYTLPVSTLLDKFGYDYDFINIDVEGCNYELFCAFPWDKLNQCKIVCVEHDNKIKEMLEYIAPYNFSFVAQNPENLIISRLL